LSTLEVEVRGVSRAARGQTFNGHAFS